MSEEFSKRDLSSPLYAEGIWKYVHSDPSVWRDYQYKSRQYGGLSILEYCVCFASSGAEEFLRKEGYIK